MKKIFRVGLLAMFFAASCSDATDIEQDAELSEEKAFQTVADLQSGLNAVYQAYTPDFGTNGSGDAVLFNDLFTDNIKRGLDNGGHGSDIYSWRTDTNTDFAFYVWSNRYSTINRINRILSVYDRIATTLPQEDVIVSEGEVDTFLEDIAGAQQIKAELLAMRALCHLDLFQYYTPDYKNASGLAVIIMDYVPEISAAPERNTVAEVLAFINSDLDEANSLIKDYNESIKTHINSDVIKAIRTRVALFSGDYALAGTLAAQLVADYPLSDPAAYQAMFRDANASELIWTLKRSQTTRDNGIGRNFAANNMTINGNPLYEVSRQLYDLFDENDVRRDVLIQVDATHSDPANNILLINKYPGTAGPLHNDYKIFRSSEMQLIVAESQARANLLDAAAASIKAIRDARFGSAQPLPVYATQADALSAILLERRLELAFEGHRFLDLKRFGVGISRLQADADSFGAPTTLLPTDYRFTIAIPQAEIYANRNITQNPGYSGNN